LLHTHRNFSRNGPTFYDLDPCEGWNEYFRSSCLLMRFEGNRSTLVAARKHLEGNLFPFHLVVHNESTASQTALTRSIPSPLEAGQMIQTPSTRDERLANLLTRYGRHLFSHSTTAKNLTLLPWSFNKKTSPAIWRCSAKREASLSKSFTHHKGRIHARDSLRVSAPHYLWALRP